MYYGTNPKANAAKRSSNIKSGEQFESLVFSRLKKCPGHWGIFTNIRIPSGQGSFYYDTDLLMIHETGIYVFECKNLSGSVAGDAGGYVWHAAYPSGKVFSFPNPVRKNRERIAALSRVLCLSEDVFRSWVVFGSLADELNVADSSSECTITKFMYFGSLITKAVEKGEAVFSRDEVDRMFGYLDVPQFTQGDGKRRKRCERVRSSG